MRRALGIVYTFSIAAVICLSGCSYRSMLDRLAPKEEVEFARARLDEIRAGRLDRLQEHFDATLSNPRTRAELERMASYCPAGEPRSVELIGSNVGRGPGWWTANLSFQYEFPDAWMVANVVLSRNEGSHVVVKGIHLQRIPDSLQHINAFTFSQKRALHYLIFVAALLMSALTIVSFVVCLRTPGIRRKWLWAVFTLVGVTGVTLNWATGQVAFQAVSIHLFGAGAGRPSPYSPWLITASFPLGAVVFLARRKHLIATAVGVVPRPVDSTRPETQSDGDRSSDQG